MNDVDWLRILLGLYGIGALLTAMAIWASVILNQRSEHRRDLSRADVAWFVACPLGWPIFWIAVLAS